MSAFVYGWHLGVDIQVGYDADKEKDFLVLRLNDGSAHNQQGDTAVIYEGGPLTFTQEEPATQLT
jgi:hypothetical protein